MTDEERAPTSLDPEAGTQEHVASVDDDETVTEERVDPVATDAGPTEDHAAPTEDHAAPTEEDAAPGAHPVDEFGFTRERVADPDDWRLAEREEPTPDEEEETETLSGTEERDARVFRLLFHMGATVGSVLTLVAAVFHFTGLGPGWLETVYVFFATGCVLLAAYAFPHARFPERAPTGPMSERADAIMKRVLILRAFGIAFAVCFVLLLLLELTAFIVAVSGSQLPARSLLLARHFVLVPVFVIAVLVAALYARMRIPSRVKSEPFEDWVVAVGAGVFTLTSMLAVFFALGIPAVEAKSGIAPHQAVYFAGVGLAVAIAVVNLRLRFPNVVRVVQEELKRAQEVDRPAAQNMQRSMMRNYVFAIVFVVGSVAFIGMVLAGLVRPSGTGSLDVVLLIYLGLGAVFLGVVGVNFLQARSIGQRVILNPKGTGPGKRRYRPDEIQRYTVLAAGGFIALVLLFLTLLVSTGKMTALGPIPLVRADGTDFFVFALLFAVGPFGFYWASEAKRVRAIDEKFPDFLRDLAESQRAGMTLPRALLTASRGTYGPLTKEIQIMAAQVEWGVSFNDALERFADRTRTPLIGRTVSLVTEAAASGGNVVDILTAASDDAREIKNIMMERKQQMSVYSMIVYIAFGVFLTVIGVLNSQFIPELAAATSQVGGASLGGIQFGDINVPTYQRIFFHAAIVQGIGGGLVSGVMTEGHPFAGLKHSMVMMMIAYVAFRFFIM